MLPCVGGDRKSSGRRGYGMLEIFVPPFYLESLSSRFVLVPVAVVGVAVVIIDSGWCGCFPCCCCCGCGCVYLSSSLFVDITVVVTMDVCRYHQSPGRTLDTTQNGGN